MIPSSLSRKERLLHSQNFKNGVFQNSSPTPMKPDDVSYFKIIGEVLNKPKDVKPSLVLPSVKTNLNQLNPQKPVIVWFGHSSYLIHCQGVNILVDPVFSGHASPFSFMVKAFKGADVYGVEDMPVIDYLILTHNHYDHFDSKTIALLQPKIKSYCVPLGLGKSIAALAGNNQSIVELDWWETEELTKEIQLTATPARHFSGRGIKRNRTLWTSFVLDIFGFKIFMGGDSGYDVHFKKIGEQYGPFELAILECGQYNTSWPLIHMMPEETIQAAVDLNAKLLLPVHWGKFALASHPWNEPIIRAAKTAAERKVELVTPMIGEPVILGENGSNSAWWM